MKDWIEPIDESVENELCFSSWQSQYYQLLIVAVVAVAVVLAVVQQRIDLMVHLLKCEWSYLEYL
jgi:hypothetical protein